MVEEYETLNPMAIALLSPPAIMAGTQGFTEAVEEFWFLSGYWGNPWVSAGWIGKNWCGVSLWHGPPSSAEVD